MRFITSLCACLMLVACGGEEENDEGGRTETRDRGRCERVMEATLDLFVECRAVIDGQVYTAETRAELEDATVEECMSRTGIVDISDAEFEAAMREIEGHTCETFCADYSGGCD
ncbi:MAG: hypothetical protein HDKAJFGB_00879 [Anaerolineae bacterium]|nr:hypothetical protein [Anaerolineae bacterium]